MYSLLFCVTTGRSIILTDVFICELSSDDPGNILRNEPLSPSSSLSIYDKKYIEFIYL